MGKRKNLHLYLDTWVHQLQFDDACKTITGVRMNDKDGQDFVLRAKHEVILCAGAVDTPRLLLLSGVGPRKELEALGIKSKVDLPGASRLPVASTDQHGLTYDLITGVQVSARTCRTTLSPLFCGKLRNSRKRRSCRQTPPCSSDETRTQSAVDPI